MFVFALPRVHNYYVYWNKRIHCLPNRSYVSLHKHNTDTHTQTERERERDSRGFYLDWKPCENNAPKIKYR